MHANQSGLWLQTAVFPLGGDTSWDQNQTPCNEVLTSSSPLASVQRGREREFKRWHYMLTRRKLMSSLLFDGFYATFALRWDFFFLHTPTPLPPSSPPHPVSFGESVCSFLSLFWLFRWRHEHPRIGDRRYREKLSVMGGRMLMKIPEMPR